MLYCRKEPNWGYNISISAYKPPSEIIVMILCNFNGAVTCLVVIDIAHAEVVGGGGEGGY